MTSEVKELVERLEQWAANLEDLAPVAARGVSDLRRAVDTLQSQERRIGELEAALEEAKKPRFHEPGYVPPKPDLHPFFPNPKYPWFCKHCGYAEHEVLKHPQRATLTTGGGHDGQN